MRIAALLTEAHGGRGGIAAYNRDLLEALAAHPRCEGVTALARIGGPLAAPLPPGIDYAVRGCGKPGLLWHALRRFGGGRRCDLVVCGHVNLLPVGWLVARLQRAPLLPVLYGIEAWRPHRSRLVNRLASGAGTFVAISDVTRRRFLSWSGSRGAGHVLHPCVDLGAFTPGPRRPDLLKRHGLRHNRILMTMARLAASERYKGIDEVLEVLPALLREAPDLAYLVCGDGDDRARLQAKAAALGVADRVAFAGHVADAEKADYHRLADAFVMPSRGEGFGIVYLEALACGTPVVAGAGDAGREVLRDGAWGELVDPADRADLARGIRAALARGRGPAPAGIAAAGREAFVARVASLLDLMAPGARRG